MAGSTLQVIVFPSVDDILLVQMDGSNDTAAQFDTHSCCRVFRRYSVGMMSIDHAAVVEASFSSLSARCAAFKSHFLSNN